MAVRPKSSIAGGDRALFFYNSASAFVISLSGQTPPVASFCPAKSNLNARFRLASPQALP